METRYCAYGDAFFLSTFCAAHPHVHTHEQNTSHRITYVNTETQITYIPSYPRTLVLRHINTHSYHIQKHMHTYTHKCPTYTKLEEKTVFGAALAPVEVTNNGAYVHASVYVHMYLYAHRHYHRLHHHDHYYREHYHMHREFSITHYPSLSLTTRFYALFRPQKTFQESGDCQIE